MVACLNKSDASERFNQVIDFLNGSYIKYAVTINLNIYVSCIKHFWNTIVIKQDNDVTRRRKGVVIRDPEEESTTSKIIPADTKSKDKGKGIMLPSASRREDRPEVTLPPRKREIMRDPERGVGYGITDSWDDIVETLQGAPVSTDTELGGYVREFESRVRQDMDEIYTRFDDEQTERQLLAGRLNMLFRDRRAHAHTPEIRELQAADRRRQTVISELLRLEHRRSTEASESRTALQGQITTL
nr:hypothetical protein [Tanacetum cinerariifolium]